MNDTEYMRRVRALEPRLWRVAQAMLWRQADCADAVQEAVFRGWMKKGGLRDEAFFETWLMRIMINACKDALRRRAREPAALDRDIPAEEGLCENLHLREALKALPEKYRLPLVLHHVEGYPVRDIARMTGQTPGRVTARLYQARQALRKLLDGDDVHETP